MTKSTLVLGIAVVVLGGCDCGEAADGAGGADPGRRTIAVVPKGTTHEFWKSIHAGAIAAGRDLSVEILWQGPLREDDRADQVRVVEDVISRGVDAIVLAPLDDSALVPPAREAAAEGIPVVIIDSDLDWDGQVSFVATDNTEGGRLAARRLGELLGGEGKVLMMRYQEGSASTMRREEGFLEVMQRDFPNIELSSTNQYGGATTEASYAKGESLLVSYPELDGIFTPNESTTFGMLRALRDADRAGGVKFVGFDSSEALSRALGEGHIHGLVLQRPFRMGELGVRTAVAHLDGEEVEVRIDTGVTMVTAENMNDPEIQGLLVPDLSEWLD
jgi:ribose transport system substrate-binding protein